MKENNTAENIAWESKFDTGIERIDFEHRIFLELINSFKKALDHNRSNDELVRIINEIEAYTIFHFTSEENFMYAIKYPDYKSHQMLHFDLLEQLNFAKYEKEDFSYFYEFIKNWFFNHTINEDTKIKSYIITNNIDNHLYNITI